MNVTIVLIVLNIILSIFCIGLAVANSKDGNRKLMWVNILTAVLNFVTAAIYVCIYLRIPPPF